MQGKQPPIVFPLFGGNFVDGVNDVCFAGVTQNGKVSSPSRGRLIRASRGRPLEEIFKVKQSDPSKCSP